MKWIKASERLPEIDGKYICRKKPVSNDDIYVAETFFNNGKFKTGHIIIEWLDESLPSGVKSAEEIEQWYYKWLSDRNKSGIVTENVLDMLKDFAASQQPVNDGWVRVEDALPERGERVISVDENYTVECSYLNVFDEWKRSADGNILRNFPTHWRTLPEPPKQTP